MTKKLRIAIFSLLLIFVFFTGISFIVSRSTNLAPTSSSKQQVQQTQQKEVTFIVDFGNGEKLETNYSWQDEKTVFDALVETAEKEEIGIETQQYDFGVFVKNINGRENTAERAWIYFVNGESGTVAADQYKLENGDIVEWRYIEPSAGD
jgi:hypothetical protein